MVDRDVDDVVANLDLEHVLEIADRTDVEMCLATIVVVCWVA